MRFLVRAYHHDVIMTVVACLPEGHDVLLTTRDTNHGKSYRTYF